jgi:chromosome segregation ATPase
MRWNLNHLSLGLLLAGASVLAVGCMDRTDMNDVQAARDNLREEESRTAEVRQEAAEHVAEAQRREDALRHEVRRPVDAASDELRDAQADTAEARRKTTHAVQEQQQDTAEAQAELRETEMKFKATQERDKFVADHQAKLDAAAAKIDALEDRASNEEGTTAEATKNQAAQLQIAHDRAEEALDNLKNADVLHWTERQENATRAFDSLQQKMDRSS